MTMLDRLNAHERQLMQRLRGHPLFQRLPDLDWQELLAVLIQRRFLSLLIVNVYEFVIDGLHSEAIRATVRSILHEEYPRNTRGLPLASIATGRQGPPSLKRLNPHERPKGNHLLT